MSPSDPWAFRQRSRSTGVTSLSAARAVRESSWRTPTPTWRSCPNSNRYGILGRDAAVFWRRARANDRFTGSSGIRLLPCFGGIRALATDAPALAGKRDARKRRPRAVLRSHQSEAEVKCCCSPASATTAKSCCTKPSEVLRTCSCTTQDEMPADTRVPQPRDPRASLAFVGFADLPDAVPGESTLEVDRTSPIALSPRFACTPCIVAGKSDLGGVMLRTMGAQHPV